MKTNEIHMRDPYVFAQNGVYYLYGTTDMDCWKGEGQGFEAYESADLENWSPLGNVFDKPEGFYGTQNFWAPEMHEYRDAYYLFASFKTPGRARATSVLKSASPKGPFRPFGAEQLTPIFWECLDGTLYIEKDGSPWLVFCHEWVQTGDGEICALRLKDDLSGTIGEPRLLFTASMAKWTRKAHHSSGIDGYVTDGPSLYRAADGRLFMLWSSLSETGYALGLAQSGNGGLSGSWRQLEEPLFEKDGGHGMIFRALDGRLLLTLHSPNKTLDERPAFFEIKETKDGLIRL